MRPSLVDSMSEFGPSRRFWNIRSLVGIEIEADIRYRAINSRFYFMSTRPSVFHARRKPGIQYTRLKQLFKIGIGPIALSAFADDGSEEARQRRRPHP